MIVLQPKKAFCANEMKRIGVWAIAIRSQEKMAASYS
jgi:hypothetical protein